MTDRDILNIMKQKVQSSCPEEREIGEKALAIREASMRVNCISYHLQRKSGNIDFDLRKMDLGRSSHHLQK